MSFWLITISGEKWDKHPVDAQNKTTQVVPCQHTRTFTITADSEYMSW